MNTPHISIEEIFNFFDEITVKAQGIAERFADDNFQGQAWQGTSPWRKLKNGAKDNSFGRKSQGILIGTGRLRRSVRTVKTGRWAFTFASDAPYAQAHNEGFTGNVSVRAHKREQKGIVSVASIKTKKSRNIETGIGTIDVQAHTRKMNLPARQFMPTARRESPVLDLQFQKMIETEFAKLQKKFK